VTLVTQDSATSETNSKQFPHARVQYFSKYKFTVRSQLFVIFMVVDDIGYRIIRKKNSFVDSINNPEKLSSVFMTLRSVISSILHIYVVSQICLFMSSIAKAK